MKRNNVRFGACLIALFLTVAMWSAPARAAEGDAERQHAIQKMAEAFVAAFEKGDAKAVAAFWTSGGDYIDLSGHVYNGRQEIEDVFAESFATSPGMRVRIDVAALRFLTPQSAVEDGTTTLLAKDGSVVSRAHYTNVLVERDGAWHLASVRESPFVPPSMYQHLRSLEWAIGTWEHDTDKGQVGGITFEWTPDNNFINSTRFIRVNGEDMHNGSQTIGWDAAAKQIRSWSFEGDGGHGESVWTNSGNTWTIKTTTVLASGSTLTSTNVVTRVDADNITVQTTDQKIDGNPLPDGPVIKMKRIAG